ncbi:MAG: 3-oxoacyl-ACP synthase III [Candidatus Dadabacteria bacterium]|nr:MAG: 3-oxoacyl-ACP synthase III [Candidatus Dadabacteria bacterium]
MFGVRFKDVCIEAYALNLPPNRVTSAELEDRLAELYKRLNIPFGTLEKLSGIKSRYLWKSDVMPSEVATEAAQQALSQVDFPVEEIGALFSCSVTRDYFEPATASIIHRRLGIREDSLSMDISNACLGFSNGMITLAGMIDSGIVKAGLVVSGENISCIIDSSIDYILKNHESFTREELLQLLPTFTLGSGAVAFVLCHSSLSKNGHRLLGSIARSASQHSELCEGNADYSVSQIASGIDPIMRTDSHKLMASAAKLGNRAWKDASELLGWKREDIDHIFCHQVGRQVNNGFYQEMGLDIEKEFTVYQELGNLVSAALPAAVIRGIEEKGIKKGDKILLTAFGSGLNAIFSGIQW